VLQKGAFMEPAESQQKGKKSSSNQAPSNPQGTSTLNQEMYAENYKTVQDLIKLESGKNKSVGYLCIYQAFSELGVTTDTTLEMGEHITGQYVTSLGEITTSKKQGTPMSADDGRAMYVLAMNYGFTGPRAGRYDFFKTVEFAEGTKLIGFVKSRDTNSILLTYIPATGESSATDALKLITDPRLHSVEWHAIAAIAGKKGKLAWIDVQQKFKTGPYQGTIFAWFELAPS
jgi:hypothetical protein